MNLLKKILLFFVVCSKVNGQQYSCTAVDGSAGICKSLHTCQPILAIVNNPYRSLLDVELLRLSHCGFDEFGWAAVCCPRQDIYSPDIRTSSQCYTPEGKSGQCINLNDCPHLANLVRPAHETINYLQRLRCTNGLDEYSICCENVTSLPAVEMGNCASYVSAYPPDAKTECCGIDATSSNKIIGGEQTAIDEYPWLAVIEYNKDAVVKVTCSGALISGKYVLTAAHCVTGQVLKLGTPTNILLGEYDTSHEGEDCVPAEAGSEDCTEGVTRIAIEKTIPHPEYYPANLDRRNDIALIRMKEMAPYTDFIRPICLPTEDITLKTEAFNLIVAGWGSINTGPNGTIITSVKSDVQLPFVNLPECQETYRAPRRNVTLWKGQLCAGGEEGKDSCKGDSGGPLMYKKGNSYEVSGIISFGPVPCGVENVPAVYTHVYEYDSWIRSNIIP